MHTFLSSFPLRNVSATYEISIYEPAAKPSGENAMTIQFAAIGHKPRAGAPFKRVG